MILAVQSWLTEIATAAFRWSVFAFVLVNGSAALLLAVRRDRALVNRWTGRVLAANLVLLGTGAGVPLAALAGRAALRAVLPAMDLRQVDREGESVGAISQTELRDD